MKLFQRQFLTDRVITIGYIKNSGYTDYELCNRRFYCAMNLYTISPVCLAGAEGDIENLDNLAALTANSLRQLSSEDTSSSTLAFSTRPEGFTVIITVTVPPPIHLYAGIGR